MRAMGVAIQQAEALRLEQIQAFLAGSGQVEFEAASRAVKNSLFDAVLRRHDYP